MLAGSVALLVACGAEGDVAAQRSSSSAAESALAREMSRIRGHVDSIDAIFQPLPLLRPSAEATLRRFDNSAQLSAARRLGLGANTAGVGLDLLAREGRVVKLADSNDHWVVRRLDSSSPYLVRDGAMALQEIAQRFQRTLARLGAPAYRLELTSALRSAENQESLRRTNVNAAAGESTHQYGTTFDIAYSAFAPPVRPVVRARIPEAPWLSPHLEVLAGALTETVGARRSRELMAVLGDVLIEMQNEGKIMVTLERLQPVFHVTVARRF